jgi:hypothetical protein
MKRDMELVRDILLKIEAAKDPTLTDLLPPNATQDDLEAVTYNFGLLVGAGFAEGNAYHTMTSENWHDIKLTWQGHELLEAIRDPEIWRRTKEGAKKVG